jgi:hypothetical protein
VSPCTLGTFSVKESLRVLWARFVRCGRESVSLCFGHALVSKRVFPCALGTFIVKREYLCFGHDSYDAAERECVCFLVLWVRLVSKSVSLYFGYA